MTSISQYQSLFNSSNQCLASGQAKLSSFQFKTMLHMLHICVHICVSLFLLCLALFVINFISFWLIFKKFKQFIIIFNQFIHSFTCVHMFWLHLSLFGFVVCMCSCCSFDSIQFNIYSNIDRWTSIYWYFARSSLLGNTFNYNSIYLSWWSNINEYRLCVQIIWGS